jgi:antitoxin VapB
MKPTRNPKRRQTKKKPPLAKSMYASVSKGASIFRNGANQAVQLLQELRFAEAVKEVSIRRQGDSLLISPINPDWASFFSLSIDVKPL